MSFTPDQIIDRKRLKARLSLWRFLAILAVFGALFALIDIKGATSPIGQSYVARLTIADIMVDDPKRDELIEEIRTDKNAKAVIVRFDTPGGTALAGEEVYLQLRALAKAKPVVAVMRTVCASAGYMAALGADHIVARENSLTGSIGVMMQSAEVSRLLDKIGVTPITVKSGEFKDSPSLTQPFTTREREVVEQSVNASYDYFTKLIAERRNMSLGQVRLLADGRVYTGSQAYELKLIDGLGAEAEARDWLAKEHKISTHLEVRDIEPEPEFESILKQLQQFTHLKFFSTLTVPLDGLVSLWHPSSQF